MRFALLSLSVAALLPLAAYAAESIDSFSSVITIRPDSSIRVMERIVYDFGTAEKHGIFRDIPLPYTTADGREGRLDISNVAVTDETGTAYPFSLSGENDSQRIKIGDPDFTITGRKTYVISYDAVNALTPYESFDELYWNATGNEWQVPIAQNSATVILPAKVPTDAVRTSCYWGVRAAQNTCGVTINGDDNGTVSVIFSGLSLNPGEGLTVAVGFPKGLVTFPPPVPWWQAFLFSLFALGALMLALIFAIYTVWSDSQLGRGTIVPQYEPPQGIKPAQADVLVHGKISKRTWPATIVDLAVRGHLSIEEIAPARISMVLKAIGTFLVAFIFAMAYVMYRSGTAPSDIALIAAFILIPVAVIAILVARFGGSGKDYILKRVQSGGQLEDYEKKFLDVLFSSGDFSTKAMRKDRSASRTMYLLMTALESDLYKETASDTNAYALEPDTARKRLKGFFALGFLVILALFMLPLMFDANEFLVALGERYLDLAIAFSVVVVAAFIAAYPVYLRPRLNREGSVEREDVKASLVDRQILQIYLSTPAPCFFVLDL